MRSIIIPHSQPEEELKQTLNGVKNDKIRLSGPVSRKEAVRISELPNGDLLTVDLKGMCRVWQS